MNLGSTFTWLFNSMTQVISWFFTIKLMPNLSLGGVLVGFAIIFVIIKVAIILGMPRSSSR